MRYNYQQQPHKSNAPALLATAEGVSQRHERTLTVNDSTPLRRCSKCGVEYPLNSEFFYRNKNRKDGFCYSCKTCDLSRVKSAHKTNPQSHRNAQKRYRLNHPEQVKARLQEWESVNREHRTTCQRERRRANPAHANEVKRMWVDANREHVRAVRRAYRLRNRIRILAYRRNRREVERRSTHDWHIRNPHKQAEYVNRRRARKAALPATFTVTDWLFALDYWNHACAACGCFPGDGRILAQDHWVSLSKGGATTPDNIVPLCHGLRGCNNTKNNRDALEWLVERFGEAAGKAKAAEVETYFQLITHHIAVRRLTQE